LRASPGTWMRTGLLTTRGPPPRTGGLPASKPGLDAGAHDRAGSLQDARGRVGGPVVPLGPTGPPRAPAYRGRRPRSPAPRPLTEAPAGRSLSPPEAAGARTRRRCHRATAGRPSSHNSTFPCITGLGNVRIWIDGASAGMWSCFGKHQTDQVLATRLPVTGPADTIRPPFGVGRRRWIAGGNVCQLAGSPTSTA